MNEANYQCSNQAIVCTYLRLSFVHLLNTFFLFQIFQALEHPLEVQTLEEIQSLVLIERENFVRFIFNGSWNSVAHRENIDMKLLEYEQTVAVAANECIDMSIKEPVYQWSYIQAVFFTSTILTTIGTYLIRTGKALVKPCLVLKWECCRLLSFEVVRTWNETSNCGLKVTALNGALKQPDPLGVLCGKYADFESIHVVGQRIWGGV